jgi:hypothetical protein
MCLHLKTSTTVNKQYNLTFIGIILSPLKTITQFKSSSRIKVVRPLFILSICYSIYAALLAYMLLGKNHQISILIKNSGTTEKRVQLVGAIISGSYTIITIVFSIIITSIILKIVSIFLGKDISFKKLLSIITYSHVIPLLGLTLNFLLSTLLGYEKIISFTNLSNIVHSKALSKMLEQFDIFKIWQFILIGMGMYYIAGWSKKQISILAIVFITLASIGSLSIGMMFESESFIN